MSLYDFNGLFITRCFLCCSFPWFGQRKTYEGRCLCRVHCEQIIVPLLKYCSDTATDDISFIAVASCQMTITLNVTPAF